MALNLVRIFFAILLMLLQIVVIVKSTLAKSTKGVPWHSVYLKILTNHLQIVGIVSGFDLNWPAII